MSSKTFKIANDSEHNFQEENLLIDSKFSQIITTSHSLILIIHIAILGSLHKESNTCIIGY